MPHSHVTDADVALFVSGRLDGLALRCFLETLSPCRTCREKIRFYAPMLDDAAPPPGGVAELPAGYEAALDAALDRVEAGLERHVARWAEEKAGLARLRRQGADVDESCEVHGWARIEHLLELSSEMRYRDTGQMLLLAQGAASVAGNLGLEIDEGRYTPAEQDDLRARTRIELANAFRLNHDFAQAKDCLDEAAGLVDEGHCDPQTEGRLMDVHASVLMDQRQLAEAFVLLDKLRRHYLDLGEAHLAGRALISKGLALHRDDQPLEAIQALRQGLASLIPGRDVKLHSSTQHTLVLALVEAGNFSEAGKLLLESGLRQAFANDPLNLLKLRWVEGKIFAGLRKLWRAEQIFIEVKEKFSHHGREYLVAMLDLELAGVLLRQGRVDEVELLAEEALEIFRTLEVGREALKAVRYLREACRRKRATAELVQQVVRFLSDHELKPGLRFAP